MQLSKKTKKILEKSFKFFIFISVIIYSWKIYQLFILKRYKKFMNIIRDLIIFGVSYSILSIICVLIFLGILMGTFFLMKIFFKMNEEKWDSLFKYKNSFVLIFIMLISFLISLIITFFMSKFFFDLINFKYRNVSSILIILFIGLPVIFKFIKLKDYIKSRLLKEENQKDLFD